MSKQIAKHHKKSDGHHHVSRHAKRTRSSRARRAGVAEVIEIVKLETRGNPATMWQDNQFAFPGAIPEGGYEE